MGSSFERSSSATISLGRKAAKNSAAASGREKTSLKKRSCGLWISVIGQRPLLELCACDYPHGLVSMKIDATRLNTR
jgi:hypothetical protein